MGRPDVPNEHAGAEMKRGPVVQTGVITAAIAATFAADALGVPSLALMVALPVIVLAVLLGPLIGRRPHAPARGAASADGLALAAAALSPALLVGVFAAVFTNGQDAHVYLLSVAAGLALATVWLAAPMQRSGLGSVSGFLAHRFASSALGAAAAAVSVLVALILAAADLSMIGLLAARFTGVSPLVAITAGLVLAGLYAWRADGGAWPSLLCLLILAAALLVPLALVTFQQTGVPSAQLGIGPRVAEMPSLEQGMIRRGLADARSMRPLLTPFLALDPLNWLGIALAAMLGTAAMPHLLARAGAAETAPQARRSFAWALLAFAVVASAVPALAVVAKSELAGLIGKGVRLEALPGWIWSLGQTGALKICGAAAIDAETVVTACRKIARHPGLLRLQDTAIDAELLLPMLPRMAGTAFAATPLIVTGLLVALMAALQGPLRAAAGHLQPDRSGSWRIAAAAIAAALLAIAAPSDPLTLVVWALSLSASALLPPLLLGVWWRRTTAAGALAGLLTGLLVCTAYVAGTRFFALGLHDLLVTWSDASPAALRRLEDLRRAWQAATTAEAKEAARIALDTHAQRIAGLFGLRSTAAALLAVPAALLATIIVSLLTRAPDEAARARLGLLRRPRNAHGGPAGPKTSATSR